MTLLSMSAMPAPSLAQTVPLSSNGPAAVNLDLSSTRPSVALPAGARNASINLAGTNLTVSPGQLLTPGQYVATRQVLSGGNQTLNLSGAGAATGGSFTLGQVGQAINQMTIPTNVSALSMSGNLITGNLANYGSLFVAPGAQNSTAFFSAQAITNYASGLISNNLSSSVFKSLGLSNQSAGLSLQTVNDITNYGTISSTGALNLLSSQGSVSNLVAAPGMLPVLSAVGDLNIFSGSGNVTNAGLIQSSMGNINITSPANSNLTIAADTGKFVANAGAINIHDLEFAGSGNISLLGGDYISKTLNVYADTGAITGNIGELTGCVNTFGSAAHFIANTAVLTLGDNSINGDPLYVNTGGDIVISGLIDVTAQAEPLAIVAKGNITGGAAAQIVNKGGDITLIAGADISSYTGTKLFPPDAADGSITINDISSGSATGGNIDFIASVVAGPIVDSSSSSGDGGKISLIALADPTGLLGGQVAMPLAAVSADSSSTTGTAGDVQILASSAVSTSTSVLGSVLAGGQVQGGNIGIYTQKPQSAAISISQTGVTTGTIANDGSSIATAGIDIGASVVSAGGAGSGGKNSAGGNGGNAGSITIAGGSIDILGSVLAYGGGGGGGSGEAMGSNNTGGNGGNGNNISITAEAALNISADVNSSGGGGGGGGANFLVGAAGGKGGAAGSISLLSNSSTVTVGANIFAAGGGDGGSGGDQSIFSTPGGGGGGGGSFGGGGGGGGSLTNGTSAGTGGGGGAGYSNLNPGGGAYALAAGGGGAGGLGDNDGGGGGGYFGGGAGGASTDPTPAAQGTAGNANVYFDLISPGVVTISGAGGGGNGGNASKPGGSPEFGLGGLFYNTIFPALYETQAATAKSGGAGGLAGAGNSPATAGQSVIDASGAGNILISGSVITAGLNQTESQLSVSGVPAPSSPTEMFGNDILIVSRDFGSSGMINLQTLISTGDGYQVYAKGSNVTLVSPGDIGFFTSSNKVSISIVAPSANVSLYAGVNAVPGMSGSFDFDLASPTPGGGNILSVGIDTSSRTADGGDITMVALGAGSKNLNFAYALSQGVNGGDILNISNSTLLFATGTTSGFQNSGNIEVYAVNPAGTLNVSSSAKVTGTIDVSGPLSSTDISTFISSSGFGGQSVQGAAATSGGNAGDITIKTGGTLSNAASEMLALGGAGGGGWGGTGDGFAGGNGGDGGNINITATNFANSGVFPLSNGTLASSGGSGGGGGGAGSAGTNAGAGGTGGKAGSITITAVDVRPGIILTWDGGDGGAGSTATAAQAGSGGGGGGGGGLGGGGGGGGASNTVTAGNGVGGGGGSGGVGGGGGGGGNILNSPSGGGGGASAAYKTLAQYIAGTPGLLEFGAGGTSGGDPAPGTAGQNGSGAGGDGGVYPGAISTAGLGGFFDSNLILGTGGEGGGKGSVLVNKAADGTFFSVSPTANGDVSIDADNIVRVDQFGIITPFFIRGRDVSLSANSFFSSPAAAPLVDFDILASKSANFNMADGGFAAISVSTPEFNLNISGGTNPFVGTVNPAPINVLSGINGNPVKITIDSKVDIDPLVTFGPTELGNISAPKVVLIGQGLTASTTILAGSQIKTNDLQINTGLGSLSQQDPTTVATIDAPSISVQSIGSSGSISFTAVNSTLSPQLLTASAGLNVDINTSGPVTLSGSSKAGAAGDGKTFSLTSLADSNGTASITLLPGSSISADTVILQTSATGNANGSIVQDDPLATPTINSNNVFLFSYGLSSDPDAHDVLLNIAPSVAGADSNLTVSAFGDVQILTDTGLKSLNVNTGPVFTSLSITNSGNINLLTPADTTGDFQLASSSGTITTVAPISAGGNLSFAGSTGIALQSLLVSATGDLSLSSAGAITIDGIVFSQGAFQTISAGSFTMSGPGSALLSPSGTTDISTDTFINAGLISAGTLNISGQTAGPSKLSITNTGIIESSLANLTINSAVNQDIEVDGDGGVFRVLAAGSEIRMNVNVSALNNGTGITFKGDQSLTGPCIISAAFPNQAIVVENDDLVVGDSLVWLKTPNFMKIGTGDIIGNPLVVGVPGQAGTIANSIGNVILPANLTFVGQDLAIIASESILSAGISTINLSGSFGGNLTLIAGFNFTPATPGPVSGPTAYTIGTPSTGGSINLPSVSINLSSNSSKAAGGNLIAVAHGGSITLGSINTSADSATGIGGEVTIIGQNGVTVGAITSSGAPEHSGQVSISAADSLTVSFEATVVENGSLISGGFNTIPGTFNNNIVLSNINAGDATVTLSTGGTGAITAPPGTNITASALVMTAGTGGIGTSGAPISSNASVLSANALGDVFLSSSAAALSLQASSGDQFQLSSKASGSIVSVDGTLSANDIVLKSTNNGSFQLNAILTAQNGGQANTVVINANGKGNIVDNFQQVGTATISSSSLQLSSGTGSMGASGSPIQTDAQVLSAATGFNTSTTGGVFINNINTSPVTISGLSAGSGSSSISYTGQASTLTVSGQVSGNAISLDNQGSVNLNNKVTGTGDVDVVASGNLSTSSQISGKTIDIETSSGSAGSVTLGGPLTSTGAVSINSDGNIVTNSTISGSTIALSNLGSSGSINIGATISGTGAVTALAQGNLSTTSNITGDGITLGTNIGTSGSVNIGGTLSSSKAVTVSSDNNIITTGTVSGASVLMQNLGASGSTTLGGTVSASSGNLVVNAKGNLTASSNISGNGITLSTATGTSGSITLGGTVSSTGDVQVLSDNSINTSGTITGVQIILDNTGVSGSITVGGNLSGSGPVSVLSNGTLSVNSPISSSNDVQLIASGNLNINAAVSGNIVTLGTSPGSNGNIALGANVTSLLNNTLVPGLDISADGVGSITQSTGVLSALNSTLRLNSTSGAIGSNTNPIAFNSIQFFSNTAGNVNLLALGSASLMTDSSANSYNLSTNGDLTVAFTGSLGANSISISTLNNGNITLGGDIHGLAGLATNALSVNLSASGTGNLQNQSGSKILSSSLTLAAVSGDIGGSGQEILTNAQNISANTQGSIFINDTRTGATNLLASSGNDFTLTAQKVNIGANSTFSGTATFNTTEFTNPQGTTLTAGNLNIFGVSPASLTVKNGGTLVANAASGIINISNDSNIFLGNAGGPTPGAMQVTGSASPYINIEALGPTGDIIFTGNQNFFGDTFLTAGAGLTQVVQVNTGVTVQGFQSVTIQTNDLFLFGTLIGNPLIFNSPSGAGTIANSQGDVLLSSDLIFNGQSLAILASGNVLVQNPSGILIDLSNSSSSVNLGRGGTLNVLAGFNFSPATGGQVGPNGAVYAIGNNPSTSGGSVDLSNATILTGTSVDAANSGDVQVAAHGGSLNTGSVWLGTVNTQNTGVGGAAGDLYIVAQGGASVASVDTTGSTDGQVNIFSATPQIIGTISDQNGNFAGGGVIQPTPTTFSGNIVLGSINAGLETVTATTGASGNVTLSNSSTIMANSLQLTSGSNGGVAIGTGVQVYAGTLGISAGSLGIAQADSSVLLDSPVAVFSSTGDIGTGSSPLRITATTLTANSSLGSVYLLNQATADVNLVNSGLLVNGAGDIYSLVSSNIGGKNTVTAGGAQINAPHVIVESTFGNLSIAVNSSLANSIKFDAVNGNIDLASSTLSVIPDSSGNGGSISLAAATLTYTGSGLSPLTLNANATGAGNGGTVLFAVSDTSALTIGNASGNLKINATGGSAGSGSGNGGSATVVTGGNLVFDPAQLNIVPLGNNGDGGTLVLVGGDQSPASTLTINTSSITQNGVGIGNGGKVTLNAPFINYQNSGTLPLTLTANGGSNGNGGAISYTSTNVAPLSIGAGSNSLNLSATSGTTGGNGGSVTVLTGGALTVSPLSLAVAPLGAVGNGGNISLLAGQNQANSPLAISGSLSANAKGAATGGSIQLVSNSSNPFVILQKTQPVNGIFGVLTVQGGSANGTISITNLGGGITLSAQTAVNGKTLNPALINVSNVNLNAQVGDLILNSSIGKSTTTSITLSAQGNITKPAAAIMTAANMTLAATTGNIGTSSPFKVTAANLSVNAGSTANIANTAKSLTLGSSSAGATNTFTLTNTGAIATTGDILAGSIKVSSGANGSIAIGGNISAQAATGSVNLSASGSGSIFNQFASGTDRISGSSILLKSSTGSIGTIGTSPVALRVTSGAITPTTSGAVNIENSSTAPLTIAGSLSRQQFLLTTQGNLTISKPIASAKQISLTTPAASNGNIAINANLGGAATTIITINAGGSGNISTLSKSILLSASQSITLTSGTGNIGSGTTSATAVSTRTPLLSANTAGSGVVNLSNSRAASLAASTAGGSFTLNGTANLTIGNITTLDGDINIISKGSLLQTNPGVTLTANNGAVLFNNLNTAGKILVANNSTIQTQGAGGGTVQIGIGPTPFVQTNNTPPTGIKASTSGGGQVFFGTKSITGPASGTPAQVNAIGKNVIFSTGNAKATAITLGNGATVTADPPLDAAAITEFFQGNQNPDKGQTEKAAPNQNLNRLNNESIMQSSATDKQPINTLRPMTATALPTYTSATLAPHYANNANFINAARLDEQTEVNTAFAPVQFNLSGQVDATPMLDFDLTQKDSGTGYFAGETNEAGRLKGGVTKTAIPEKIELGTGAILLAPSKKTLVQTQEGELQIDAGSVVLVMAQRNGLSIFNFDDTHRGAVQFNNSKHKITLAPGRHCTISSTQNFAEINPAEAIPHRNLSATESKNRTILLSEFSIPVALEKVAPLAKLSASRNIQARKLLAHLLKTAAVITQMNRSNSGFQQYRRTPITAFTN